LHKNYQVRNKGEDIMRFIISPSKRIILTVVLLFIIILFGFGFLMGDRYGESIAVLNKRMVPIYKVDRNDNKISITLDGTWGDSYTEKLLEIFEKNDIRVSFFFAGYWLEKYPNLVKKIASLGHDIGNHTYTHPHCNSISVKDLEKELQDTSKLIEKLTGKKPRFFRPPFGEYNNQVIKVANNLSYQVIQWSIDSHDWQDPGIDYIVNRVLDKTGSGDIILMHNNAPDTPEALEKIIPELKKRGFKIVPLSELVYDDNYYIESHSGLQVKQGSKGD
jgi:peptidoglycan-N-acetylglucosamine deacetylase